MFITRRFLPRRTFLRGVGATMALPLLDAMVPALSAMAKTAAVPPRRFGCIYMPMGAIMPQWTPAQEGSGFEFSRILKPLEPFRDRMTVLTGLSAQPAKGANGAHTRAVSTWLNQVHTKMTEGADVRAGTTIDQVAATRLGEDTKLRSLELTIEDNSMAGTCEAGWACTYANTLSWSSPTTPLPMLDNPRIAFERLFGDGGPAAVMRAQQSDDRSILDGLTAEIGRLQKGLGPSDRGRVDEYLHGVREVERRLQRAEAAGIDIALPNAPAGIPDTFDEHVKLMFDLQVLAYQADVTRVITFMMSRESAGRTYENIGVIDAHHAVSHHGNIPEKMEKVSKINTYHVQLVSYFVEKLRATPDGDGSLLDHTMTLFGSGMSDPNEHSKMSVPTVLIGGASGGLKGGRHLRYPVETPLANLLLTMLDKAGVSGIETFGDSTGLLADV